MKIFKISHDNKRYDFYMAHVIIANNNNEVINLAKHISADEGISIWDKAIVTEVRNIYWRINCAFYSFVRF